MHSASCPFKVNLSLWPSISSSICLSSKNTCDTAVLESFEGTKNCHVNIILIRNDYVDLCHLSQRSKKQTSFRQIQDSCDWHIHTYLIKKRNDNGVAPAQWWNELKNLELRTPELWHIRTSNLTNFSPKIKVELELREPNFELFKGNKMTQVFL